MIKILFIGPFPKPLTGLSLSNKVLFEELTCLGYKPSKINTSPNSFDENVGEFGIMKVLFYLKVNFLFYKIFNRNKVVITIGQSFYGVIKYFLFIIVAKLLGKELIIHLHGSMLGDMYDSLSHFKKSIIKFILSRANKAIVLSESHIDIFERFIDKNQIYVLPNFIEKSILPKGNCIIKDFDIETPNIIFLSNLMTEKGVFYVFEALKILNSKKIKFKAQFAGDIDKNIRDTVYKQLSEISNTEYLGVVRGEEKIKLLSNGHVFIFPSYLKEGFPLSILEAMLYKNIIVSTKHSSLIDYFGLDRILYIDKKSDQSIALKLEFVLSNLSDYKNITDSNYRLVKKEFSEINYIRNFLSILVK